MASLAHMFGFAGDELARKRRICAHDWTDWKEIGRTGDWFHPLIVKRECKTCGAAETDEH